jgi:DNA-directed RNA polymerase alpha subunit
MQNHYRERWGGPIRGLQLPLAVWNSLQNAGITTMDQLKAVEDRLERTIPGVGPRSARIIREELARVSAVDRHPSDKI